MNENPTLEPLTAEEEREVEKIVQALWGVMRETWRREENKGAYLWRLYHIATRVFAISYCIREASGKAQFLEFTETNWKIIEKRTVTPSQPLFHVRKDEG